MFSLNAANSNGQNTAAAGALLAPSRPRPGLAKRLGVLITLVVVGLGVIPGLYYAGAVSIETVNMLGRYTAFAIVAVGLDLVWGYTGILCLCQSLFFAFGGYAMGMYLALHGPLDDGVPRALYVVSSSVNGVKLPWFWEPFRSLPVAILLGMLLPGLLAFVIGYFGFASRVRGVYFSILTQAITFAAFMVFCLNNLMLCGTNGLTNFEKLAGYDLTHADVKMGLYLATVASLIGVYLLCRYITDSRLGRVLIAIRDNESRLRFSGYKPHHFKVFVFTLSAMIAGLGGMLYAPQEKIVTPTYMTVEKSILVVIWVAVGGRGTLSGAILGAICVNLLYNYLTSHWPVSWPFVQGGLFIAVVLFFPNGLISLWQVLRAKIKAARGSPHADKAEADVAPETVRRESPEDVQRRLSRVSLMQRTRPTSLPKDDLVKVENVQVLFDGFKALDIDSFSVGYYELRVVIGPNGAGKTTLCDVISGKTRATSGKVTFASQDITSMSDVAIARLGVGRKFQTPTVFDSLTVSENMELASPGRQALFKNFTMRQTPAERERIESILRRVRLIDQQHTQVKYLSHGQRQWLEISMLILASPILLLIDEPAAGLTDEETVLTAELLLELQDEHSIIVIEHDMDFVRLLASRIAVLNEGKIMADGTMDEVQADPNVIEAYWEGDRVLKVENLSFSYGAVKALRDVNMTMNEGKVTCVMGRNGVGKTTLMKNIMGILRASHGSVRVGEQDLTHLTANRRARAGVALVPQGRQIFPKLSVEENLQVGLAARADRGGAIPPEIYDLFPILKTMSHRMGGDLSGGQQQQLAIARALVGRPKILLLDEPTEGIQPNIIQQIGQVLHHLVREMKMTVVLVEQYLDFVREFGHHFYIMNRGRVVVEGTTAELTTDIIARHLSV